MLHNVKVPGSEKGALLLVKRIRMELITTNDIISATKLRGLGARQAASLLKSTLKLNKINDIYSRHYCKDGLEFAEAVLKEIGINFQVNETELERIPRQGSFIIVSNHPYGGIEALILMKLILTIRPDLKIIGNFLFHRITPIKDIIFPVNPFENNKDAQSSLAGLKEALKHLDNGRPLLIFPAGEVSTFYPENKRIADKKWDTSAMKFIRKANVPVLPIFFGGTNSMAFHMLGFIHPSMRTAKIPSELLNKRNQLITVRIGNSIPVKEQERFKEISSYTRYLRAKTYALESAIEVKKFFRRDFVKTKLEAVLPPVSLEFIQYDIDNLSPEHLLFSFKNYKVYCAPSKYLPNILVELGRLREITFREVGEGTNMRMDVDEYDLYYHHLFIWDEEKQAIIGAYRIGKGAEIMEQFGAKGFYTRSLFKYKHEFHPFLAESVELGRSFIVKEYQRNPHSLFLLWKGIFYFLLRNQECRYLIGPVSISNRFTELSKTLIIQYIIRNHYNAFLASYVKPRKRFRVNIPNVDIDILTDSAANLNGLDKIISDIEPDNYKIPVLLKKYLQLNGKIICFNIDPKFNDAIDGLLVLDLYDVPEDTLNYLSKELEDNTLKQRIVQKKEFDKAV